MTRYYPSPNPDAVNNPDGSISFTLSICNFSTGDAVVSGIAVTTPANATYPMIRDACLSAVGEWLRQQAGGDRAAIFNASVAAESLMEGFRIWAL